MTPTSDQIAAALGGYPHDSEGNVQTPTGTKKATGKTSGGGGSSSSKKKTVQFTPEQINTASNAGLTEADLQERQRQGIEASRAGVFYPQERNLYSGVSARQYKVIKDAEKGKYYQQVPNLYTEADIRNQEQRVKDYNAAMQELKPYQSGGKLRYRLIFEG
jgi:hypothetical protein